MSETFIGRQAIYDRSLGIHAYELLYRSGTVVNAATHVDGDKATARVLVNAFLELGAGRLAGEAVCFINLTEPFLTGKLPLPLPAERVVIEVLEDVLPTPEVIEGVRRLKAQGVKVAMDDYIHREENDELLALCDYVKIDLKAQGREETAKLVGLLRPYGMKLLAEKVETEEEMEFCRELGFDYFQGYFLTKPEIVEGRSVPTNRMAFLRMLSRLLDPNVEMEELQEIISQDVSLAYRLLRYANSSIYGPSQPITAIGQTLVMLGLKAIRKIVSLIILVELDDKPGDLLAQSLVRAKMCEVLAQRVGVKDTSAYYTVGLLSTLDALTGSPMATVLEDMPLAPELEEALLGVKGDLGDALNCVMAFERGEWMSTSFRELNPTQLTECYADGVEYSREIWNAMPKNEPWSKAS
ncbi:MAG: EAL and modified HD-GYP domain-containing signal transduction protein [Candidatus Paceibacteria bacterium]|jgi:EAL and modified HD-GYP domain-containing signal transduction protein